LPSEHCSPGTAARSGRGSYRAACRGGGRRTKDPAGGRIGPDDGIMVSQQGQMQAWTTSSRGDLVMARLPIPTVTERTVLVRVIACGVCRTDLHVIDGELPRRHDTVVPGHQVVGEVVETGADVSRFTVGDRIGIAWLRSTCGACQWCLSGR